MTNRTFRGGAFYDSPAVFARYTDGPSQDPTSANFVMEEPAVLAEVGDFRGLRVLDLGCGDADFGRRLLAAGAASYLGIDGSSKMIARAEQVLAGTSGVVRRADLEDFEAPPASFDLVTCRLALHYVAEPGPVLERIRRALVDGGRLVLSVVHPVLTSHDAQPPGPRTSWVVDDYFVTGARERQWLGATVTWYHRTIEQYLSALSEAGFTLIRLRECEPAPDRFGGNLAELERRRRVPAFLLLHGQRS
jgi:SAM-dependent methyltransferase